MKPLNPVFAATCAALTGALLSAPAVAEQYDFNAVAGDWSIASNWSHGIVPCCSDSVFIQNGGTCFAGASQTCNLVTIGQNSTYSTLQIHNGGTLDINSMRLDRGQVTVNGAGSTLTVGGITIGLGNSASLSIENGGVVNCPSVPSIGYIMGISTLTVDGAGSTWNSAGLVVGGVPGVNSSVTGTLTLSNGGQANVTGEVALAASTATGIVNIGNGGAPGIMNAASVNGVGTATLNFNHNSTSYDFTTDGQFLSPPVPITGSTAVRHIGPGVTALEADNTYTGGTTVKQGTLVVREGGSINHPNALMLVGEESGDDATLVISAGPVTDFFARVGYEAGSVGHVEVSGIGTWTNHNGTDFNDLHLGLSGTGSLDVNGGGTVESRDGTLGLFVGGDGSAVVDGNGTTWTMSRNLIIGGSGTGELTVESGGTVDVDGILSLAGGSGSTGTLNIGSGGAAGILTAANVSGGAGIATLNFNHSDANYFFTDDGTTGGTPVIITGTTAVNHLGSGTTTLTGNHTYTGATTIDDGTLVVNGSISNSGVVVNAGGTLGGSGSVGNLLVIGGTVAPGTSAGTLTAISYTQDAGSTLKIEITGATPGIEYDQLTITGGNVNLGQQVSQVTFPAPSGAFAPTARLYIIDNTGAGTTNGAFADLPDGGATGTPIPALAGLGGFAEWRIFYHADSEIGQLTGGNDIAVAPVTETDILGDMNCDGVLNYDDIAPFALALVDPAAYAAAFPNCDIQRGDINGDENVNGIDAQGMLELILVP